MLQCIPLCTVGSIKGKKVKGKIKIEGEKKKKNQERERDKFRVQSRAVEKGVCYELMRFKKKSIVFIFKLFWFWTVPATAEAEPLQFLSCGDTFGTLLNQKPKFHDLDSSFYQFNQTSFERVTLLAHTAALCLWVLCIIVWHCVQYQQQFDHI